MHSWYCAKVILDTILCILPFSSGCLIIEIFLTDNAKCQAKYFTATRISYILQFWFNFMSTWSRIPMPQITLFSSSCHWQIGVFQRQNGPIYKDLLKYSISSMCCIKSSLPSMWHPQPCCCYFTPQWGLDCA